MWSRAAFFNDTVRWHHPLFGVALSIFFFSLFNGIVAYLVPLVMDSQGFSDSQLGLLYATSSGAGALFDLIMSRVLRTTEYRRMFLLMFVIALCFPLVLWKASSAMVFIAAMELWGIYYDFFTYGRFDFVGRLPHNEHARAWEAMNAAQAVGLVLAPFIAGAIVADSVTFAPYAVSLVCLVISYAAFYTFITRNHRERKIEHPTPQARVGIAVGEQSISWHRWVAVVRKLSPVLSLTFFFNVLDSFFWVVGPLLALQLSGFGWSEGLLLSMYSLPALFVGRALRRGSARWGKKRVSFVSCAIGSLLLVCFGWIDGIWMIYLIVFIASWFFALSLPALNGAYADYIQETPRLAKQVEAAEDFFANSGYVVGPILAGISAQMFGDQKAFVVVGCMGAIIGFVLLLKTPRSIQLNRI